MSGQTAIYNNVVRSRVMDNGTEVEDVTSITLPSIEHPTTEISTNGMAGAMSLPDSAFINSMTMSIAHNNGKGASALCKPGRHAIIINVARQKYDTAGQEIGFKNVTYKMIVLHTKSDKGKVETKNPLGTTDDFSVTRYEEIVEGTTTILIDVPGGIVQFDGEDYTSQVEAALNA